MLFPEREAHDLRQDAGQDKLSIGVHTLRQVYGEFDQGVGEDIGNHQVC